MFKPEIERLFHVGFNPFRIRARYRKFKPEKRWVKMPGGKMIQVEVYPHKNRKREPYTACWHYRRPTGLRQIFRISNPRWWRKNRWWEIKSRLF